jgi:hypothetical protein
LKTFTVDHNKFSHTKDYSKISLPLLERSIDSEAIESGFLPKLNLKTELASNKSLPPSMVTGELELNGFIFCGVNSNKGVLQ